MTTIDQAAAAQTVSPTKDAWVKPEITSFAQAVEAQGNGGTVTDDGGPTNLS